MKPGTKSVLIYGLAFAIGVLAAAGLIALVAVIMIGGTSR